MEDKVGQSAKMEFQVAYSETEICPVNLTIEDH